MKRKMLRGLVVLILLLITAGVFLLTQRDTDTEPNIVFDPPSDEVIKRIPADIAERNAQAETTDAVKPPPPGKTFEGGGHWHGDEWHDAPHIKKRVVPDVIPEPIVTKQKTEPMPDNPVAALREYMAQKGHWSAEWIPDFPSGDTEAAQMSWNILRMLQHRDAGNTHYDGPVSGLAEDVLEMQQHYTPPKTPRAFAMMKLTWAFLDTPIGNPEHFKVWQKETNNAKAHFIDNICNLHHHKHCSGR